MALGEAHLVILFAGGELAVCGNNDHGQLGIKLKERAREINFVSELTLLEKGIEKFEKNNL